MDDVQQSSTEGNRFPSKMSDTTSTNISAAQADSPDSGHTGSLRQSSLSKPGATKRLFFYKSGDTRFNGIKMVVTNRSIKTFDALLDSLSKKVPLPFGVRNITTPRGIHHVTTLEELEDGKSYICSHQRKIKPINLEKANKKPLRWQSSRPISARRRVVQLAQHNEIVPFQRENTIVFGNSKKLVVFKNGDTEFKLNIMFKKKSMENFDTFLQEISEAMQCAVFKLYSTDGRRILSTHALLLSSGTIVAAGREPFKHANYETEMEFLPAKLPGITKRVIPKQRSKPEMKSPGKWMVSIITSDIPSGGTTSQVYVTFYGHRKASEPVFLYSNDEDAFQNGHEDRFVINIGDIGDVFKIRIGHDHSGESPSWHCEEIGLLNCYTNEQFSIKVNRWLAQDQDDGELCREIPLSQQGHEKLPVAMYEINVVTGDLWNAGTEANVFISILGARGDTGSRQLVKSNKPNTFVKGQTDTFLLEAVHLGALNTVVIGHDGLEPGNGWYLEKVIVHDPVKDKEFIFFCYRWLDEGEEDGNIARQLYLTDEADFPARQELELKRKQLWNAEKWKYQKGNILQFYCKATRKFIRLTQDNKVDALGEKNDKYGFFEVIVKRGNVRVFNSHLIPNLAMAIDKEVVTAMHNSGILCELLVHLQLNRTVVLESTRVPGLTVSFGSDGNPSDGGTSGYAGISKEFVVHVKGIFQNGSIILMSTNWSQALCRRPDGRCSGAGIHNAESYWRVHKIDPAVCMLESVAHPQRYLQIKTGQCDGNGSGDDYCHFKVDKNLDNGSVTLESVRQSGIYIGLQSDGSTVPMVHTGDRNTIFYPKVIQFGKKKIKGTPETPTQKEEIIRGPEDFVKAQRQVAWSSSTSASSNKIEPTRSERLEEDSHRLNEWMEWKVSVLTGSVGTGAKVSLWVYGSKGKAGPVTLENKGQGQIFQPQQEDKFMVKLPIIGKLYKIRIEHDGSSDQPEWNLQSVFLQKLKNGKTYYFEVNRWLSKNREDCEIMCEIPVTENGTFIYPIVKYQVKVYTGSFEKAGTDAPVYICIHGERGDTGKRILFKSGFQHIFQRGQLDVFQIEAVSLGKPEKVLLGCEANHKSQYWHCEKVIIREQGTDSEYIFNCERWLPFMSEGVLHSEIELLVKEMQIAPAARELTGEADGSWKINVITGNFQEAATDATVILYVYGDVTNSGPIILGSGGHQLFDTNSEDTFQVQLKHTGKPYKIRIGHDNSGENPNWYLEAVRLKNLWSEEEFYLPVNRWIGEEKEDGATWREFALPINGNYTLKLLDYEVQVYSEATSSPDSESYLYINIFGSRGDSGKRKLYKPQNERRKVHNKQVDKFIIQAVSLGPVEKIQISRDRAGSGNSWFLDKLWILYTEDGTDHRILFPCSRWLDVNEDNEMTEIELFASKQENPEQEINDKTWNIQIKTAKDSSPVKNMKVYIVIYGSEGKTDDLNLLPQDHGAVPFLPHAMDEFVVECRNVGEIFKIRVVCSDLPVSPGWHLKHLRMKELQSKEELYIDCNCWLSVETDGEDAVKEFPVDSNKHQPLPVYEYIVAVHIGGHWGAETSANVYLTLYGDHGDTGARKLHKSLSPGEKFARNKVDYFLLEAVSLGQLRKVALGHDGEGYGAGMYLKMVTVKQSNDSNNEWVFPCWNWLDNYLGICEMVCSLHTIGWRLSMDPNPIAQLGGLWIIDITGSECDRSEISAQFDIWFYGDKDKEKVEAKIVGNALHIEESLQNIGSLQKVRFSWSNIQLKNAWHLSSLHLKNTVTNEEMQLTANCWMKPNEDNCIEIPAIYPNKDPLPVVDYTIYVYTGEMKNSNAAASVYISMEGEHGDTGYRALAIAGSDGLSFSNNQVDTFKIKAVHLGRLQRILVGYKSPSRDPWFLEKIVIKDATFSFTSFLFVHNDWLSCDQETESLEYVIPLKEMISEDSTVKTISTETKGKWIMQMQVSSTREENENINISVVVFGRTGKSPLFNIKKMGFDPFLLDVGDIGEIIKVSFLSTDQSHETRLQLHKVRMRDVDTKQEISFYPEDEWLPEKEPVIELPAILPNVPPLPVVSYSVRIRTGSIPASGTDADVFITVFGENGDTCKRKLQHSSFPSTFERGKVNVFDIKAVDLGMPTKVHIEHNAVGYGGGWYLDELTIQDSDKRDAEYWFPCQQWLDMGITDKQTQRELKLCGIINKNIQNISTSIEGTLDVIVVSGDIQDEGNSFDALFTICCERGDYEPVRFARGSLQQDGTCQTTVELNKDLGAIRKVRLQMDGASKGTKWFCKEVKLHHKQSNEFIEFPFLQIFTNNGKTTAELPALCTVGPILSVKTYSVYITTNQSMQLPGDTHMFITLRGSLGNSGRTTFSCKKNEFTNKTKTAGFQLECVDIGVIQELLIERENKTNLQLEKAVVGEGKFMKKKYVFAAQQWKKEKNKILSMTLRVTEVHEERGADALVYGTQPVTSDGEWDIHLMTSIQKDRQQIVEFQEHSTNLVFVFYGDKGKSDPITIETNKVSQVKDLPVYKINLKNDLGELYKVRLGLEEWIETTGFLSLHHLKMKNVKTMATFNYSICQTLPLLLNGDRWIEIPVEWPLKPSLPVVTYYVHVFGTLSHDDGFEMTLCLNGKNGDTGDRRLTWQKSNNEHGNMLLTAILQAVEIGEMFHADISISSKHDCQLCIKRIHIKESSKKDIYAFDVNQELSIDANEPQRRQVLLSQVIHDKPDQKEGSIDDQVEYLIKVYTGDVIGAGTNAHVQISLFGHQDSFGPVELNQPLEHHNPFERGNVDTFKVLTHNLGRIIYIEVGHDGKGYGSGWFLDRIEITNLTTNYVTSFSYNRWLSEGEDDGSTTIQIYC